MNMNFEWLKDLPREDCELFQNTVPELAWIKWRRKHTKLSVRTPGNPAGIRTDHPPSTDLGCFLCTNLPCRFLLLSQKRKKHGPRCSDATNNTATYPFYNFSHTQTHIQYCPCA